MSLLKHLLVCFVTFVILQSCKTDSQLQKDIAAIPMDISVERFETAFHKAKPEQLSQLKGAFPFMFSERYPDAFWISQMQDSLQQDLRQETIQTFKNFSDVTQDVEQLFKHIKYYVPSFKTPRIVTATSSVDYRNKVLVTDSIVLISLDTYLGNTHKFYDGIPKYLVQNFERDQIVVDLAAEYAKKYTFPKQKKTLLQEMIHYGKQLYFKDVVVPFKTEAQRIGYTQEQLEWAQANESEVWRYFIDKELLYSTDSKLPGRFINPAPFSKFYLQDIDNESPGRVGQYLGWQIVRAYMANNEASVTDMLATDAQTIFEKSRFKPKR